MEFPVLDRASAHDLRLVFVQRVAALLPEADGHHEVDDGRELVQLEVEAVGQRGQVAVEPGRLSPVQRLHRVDPDALLGQRPALLPPVDLELVERVVGAVGRGVAHHDQGPAGPSRPREPGEM